MSDLDIRFPLDPASLFKNCPEESGVYSIESEDGDVLWIDFAFQLVEAIQRYLPDNVVGNEILQRQGRFFRYFLCNSPNQLGKFFDAYVKKVGVFPKAMKEAPPGSRWFDKPPPPPPEPRLLGGLSELADLRSRPGRRPGGTSHPGSALRPPPAPPSKPPEPRPERAAAAARAPAPLPPPVASAPKPRLPPEPIDAHEASTPPGKPETPRVLLVDDDLQLLVLMKEILEIEGYRVYAAANKKMLNEAMRVSRIDALILDYHLDDMTAEMVMDGVQRKFPKVKMYIVTGSQQKEMVYRLLKRGVRKIFPKPFSMKMLAKAIGDDWEKAYGPKD